VAETAGELLLREPLQAIPYLTEILQNHEDERVRAKAVFLLFRTHSPRAWHRMQMGLEDSSSLVRAATARALGNAAVYTAVDGLINALEDESLEVGLQAATALGQIGDPKASEPLLAALKSKPHDRYFEHAVIYALIHLQNEAILKSKIGDIQLTKAILIALDQKGRNILDKESLAPYLYAEDAAVFQSAVWVLGNHPDWFDLFLDRFELDLDAGNTLEKSNLTVLFPIFKEQTEVQEAIGKALKSPNLEKDKKRALIELIGENPINTFPESYKEALTGLLIDQGSELQHEILDLAIKLNLRDFDGVLEQLKADDLLIRQKACF
jgi:HEAT repeat protein